MKVGGKWIIQLGKAVTLMFWLAELANLFQVIAAPWSKLLHVCAVAILAVHLLEAAMLSRLFATQLSEPKYHKMMTLIFGVFHWLPLRQNVMANVAKSESASRPQGGG